MHHDIKSITFDMFNTLIYPTTPFVNFRDVSDILVENGYEIYPQELEAARNYVFFIDLPKGGLTSWEKWTKRIFSHLGYPNPSDDIVEKYISRQNEFPSGLKLFDDAVPTINTLFEMNIPISIVTTIPEFRFKDLIEPIYNKFKVIVTGDNAGCSKGNPKMYNYDLKKKNVNAENNLFVGDDLYYDIELPKKMGQITAMLNRSTDNIESTYSDYIISSLSDVINIL